MITTSSVDPHPKSRTDLAATWPPTSDVAREAGQEAERFTELDDNANQPTPADTPIAIMNHAFVVPGRRRHRQCREKESARW